MDIIIRYALENDLKEIVEIYNQAIKTRTSIAYTNELTVEDRKEWFFEHTKDNYPILVAEKNNFEKWGFLPEVAEIDGNKLSHVYYGLKL